VPHIEIEEELAARVEAGRLGEDLALRLHQRFSHLLEITFPNPLHPTHYQLRSRGWVGQLALGELRLDLRPKLPLGSLFGMVEEAYGLSGLRTYPGVVRSGSLPQVFGALAGLLAGGVCARVHQGLYRAYRGEEAELGLLRGRVLFPPGRRPGALRCAFEEHSADIPDNQILLWTLGVLRSFAFADPAVKRQIRLAHRLLGGLVGSAPFRAEDCRDRLYHRLNREYEGLHGLCRFFLEHRGPQPVPGEHTLPPFALHLPTLFERFAARWFQRVLPHPLYIEAQHRAPLEGSPGLAFHIDLVLREGRRGRVLAVLDTKYKALAEPASEEVQQVVAYAVRLGATRAFLVYPTVAAQGRAFKVGDVKVETLGFALEGELEEAGQAVLKGVLAGMKNA